MLVEQSRTPRSTVRHLRTKVRHLKRKARHLQNETLKQSETLEEMGAEQPKTLVL